MCIGIAPKTTLLNQFPSNIIYAKFALIHTEMISAYFLWGKVPLRGETQTDAKNSHFDIFESALYMKSGSIPLTGADPRMVQIGTGALFWQINHANSAYYGLF